MAQKINVNATPGLFMPSLKFSQGDIGREFEIEVVSSDGFAIPVGATVTCVGTKPSGMGFTAPCTFSGDTVSLVATDNEGEVFTDEKGRFPAELRIEASGDIIGTANFYMESEPSPHPDGTIDGEAEQLLPTLTQMVNEIEQIAEDMHTLTVLAVTLEPNDSATATYNSTTNTITFGIPRGHELSSSDDGDGNITLSFI